MVSLRTRKCKKMQENARNRKAPAAFVPDPVRTICRRCHFVPTPAARARCKIYRERLTRCNPRQWIALGSGVKFRTRGSTMSRVPRYVQEKSNMCKKDDEIRRRGPKFLPHGPAKGLDPLNVVVRGAIRPLRGEASWTCRWESRRLEHWTGWSLRYEP